MLAPDRMQESHNGMDTLIASEVGLRAVSRVWWGDHGSGLALETHFFGPRLFTCSCGDSASQPGVDEFAPARCLGEGMSRYVSPLSGS